MADDVPVCDVLCEAMEYLSKLGSNLRARSENLKEKRIRKDKLKNYHAVQKAADKVLLICQLSKKSLENVELGVRKVLTLMSSSQSNSTAIDETRPPETSTSTEQDRYRYFRYRSTKLKVAKKVPVKHFLSVRVLARNMPMSMHDDYPVYHNCKLYRARKRKERMKSTQDIFESANVEIYDTMSEQVKTDANEADEHMGTDNVKCNSLLELKTPEKRKSSEDINEGAQTECPNSLEVSKKIDHKNKRSHQNSSESDLDNDKKSHSRKRLSNKKTARLSQSSRKSKDSESGDGKNLKSCKGFQKIRVIDDDSSDDNKVLKPDDCEINKKVDEIQESLGDPKSCTAIVEGNNLNDCDSPSEMHKSKKLGLESSMSEKEVKNQVSEKSSTSGNESGTENTRNSTSPVRPLIKCVNINKLLKPDVQDKNESPKKKEKVKKENSRNSDTDDTSRNKENMNKKSKKKKVSVKNDEEFWELKRKEVSAFVSKMFVINLTRLPELSEKFLKLYNLTKIIKNDNVIIELSVDKDTRDKEKNSVESNVNCDTDNAPRDQINVVKNALLNDSDSEKSDISVSKSPLPIDVIEKTVKAHINQTSQEKNDFLLPLTELEKTIKNVLDVANEMNEDNSKSQDNQCESSTVDKVKNALLNDSDSENEINSEKAKDQSNKNSEFKEIELKNKLLAESDNENNTHDRSDCTNEKNKENSQENSEIPVNTDGNTKSKNDLDKDLKQNELSPNKDQEQDKSDGNEISPSKRKKHKRKHIMESMHAKKMLLTYSSSSDTEDEQLRNALKEIKDSLLKGVSSSDDEKKKEAKKPSSSEEDDVLIKPRRKRKSKNANLDSENEDQSADTANQANNESDESFNSGIKSSINSDQQSKSSSKKMGRSRAQPGGSSQNSDSQDPNDKDIDGLTNLNNLTKSRRRRDSTSTNSTATNSIKKSSAKMAKTPLISEDNMLKAESSSDAGSAVESDAGDDGTELPSISITGLNGSSVDHLAKDDLLEESDTSASHKGDSSDVKKTDDSDDEAVKLKRRKAHLISSDSEAGSSRRNHDKAVKLSDFEDSEEDSSEAGKRSKRKKKSEESDASAGSSSNDGSKKKRRRIKQLDSDVSGSDTENEGRNKHGRKNIRKVMGKNQLEEATKKAAREEKERIARIAERQKVYNNLEFDETGKPDEVVLEKVILDFDPETKEPLIQVDRGLVKKLKPHQANGIKFMWDACFESVKRIKKDRGSGCILAHCMGLGKTLQVVSLTHTLLTHSDLTSVNRVLVVCPLSTVLNWVNEFKMWLKHAETDFEVDVYELSRHKQNSERAFQLQQWFEGGGVCVLGYEMFRNLSADNNKKFKKKMLRNFQESLVDPGPDLVVCDEGHLLKNEKTSLSQSMNRVKTHRRIVLTGTPLQNNLKEYYCMVQFVKPNLLGKYNEYLNRFVNPITNGQYTDSTEHDIRIMKRRSHVLHKMLDGAVQRRDYGVLAPFLPPKHEYVLFITLTDVQVKLYQHYLENYSRRPLPGKSSGFLFPDFQSLQRIWTHPLVLKYNSERYEIMQQKKREREEEDSEGSLVDFIDDDSTPDESSTEESSDDLSDLSDDSRKKSKKKKSAKKSKKDSKVSTRRGTRANPVEMDEDEPTEVVEMKYENPTEWWIKLVEEEELEDMRNSHKLVLLFDILRQCETIGDKLLVFSQSLYSLDLIEHFLGKVDEATQEGRIDEKLGGHVGSWSPGVDYFRLDGSTSCENRSIWCKNFNREDNPRARLFLISTRAGGLGINLVAANRVVIFDVSWNPSHDVQSIFRVYRFGQKKPCYIYRFLAMGTMEEKIYERQVTKQAISKRVIDEQQIDRHYAENDLAELYKFEASPPVPRPIPPLPKDRLFAEMLREHEAQIYKYHEHDSLLENKEEETLSEEERKAAWEDFENEKNRPPPAPFPSAWPMHNGMVPGLLAQQQQQLAYAALAAMVRKDMPNINDNQIRDMLPLIYNANPTMFGGYDYGLMQKMSEIYKYAQPGMMNPGMMNPVMNAGGGGGGGMGGTSGLQYEPPWQRQHQQQQQLRLQQLMQQNPMGAKYYAGGLGSRDPVAMALQQQRAREIMSGERGRPRGRPPLQPRAPMPPQGDVVNLDSD